MTPNPVIRLTSVVQTLEHVVFPAVDQSNSLAIEQCGLVLAQLRMMIGHLPWIGAYHQLCFEDIAATAEALPAGEGGPETLRAAAAVAEALATARAQGDPLTGFHQIGTALDTRLRAVARDGAPPGGDVGVGDVEARLEELDDGGGVEDLRVDDVAARPRRDDDGAPHGLQEQFARAVAARAAHNHALRRPRPRGLHAVDGYEPHVAR